MESEVRNKKWDEDVLRSMLAEVLRLYPTGQDVDLEEAVEYHRSMPPAKNVTYVYQEAEKEGKVLIQPRAGTATIEDMIALLRCLQDEGGADILPMTVDTYTRRMQFRQAEIGLEESKRTGRSHLNGFPAAIHGVAGCRRVVEAVSRPVTFRTATGTPQFNDAIAFAGGATECGGGAVALGIPNSPQPVAVSIRNYQFVNRLMGWFEERGVTICMEQKGCNATGIMCPPSLQAAYGVIDVLLAAEQGVKSQLVAYFQNNCVIQDIAGMRVQRRLAERYLNRFGYKDTYLGQAANSWRGCYPEDLAKGYGIISVSTAIAAYGGVVKVCPKSVEEGLGASSKEANAASCRSTRQVLDVMRGQQFPRCPELELEEAMIESEATAVVERVLDIGDGDIAVGTVRAFESGVIEYPYCSHKSNAGKVILVRDKEGAVRYLNPGYLPLPKEAVQYHQERIRERQCLEGVKESEMVVDDIRCVRSPVRAVSW
ncbi:MAG: methylaspartate mutase subunit E [Chloroflexi bacterium]|nr:methylaspartate mutase subunit E [Chloroflexota bacterium]